MESRVLAQSLKPKIPSVQPFVFGRLLISLTLAVEARP